MPFLDLTWSTNFMKNQIFYSVLWLLEQNTTIITFLIHISWKIWIYFEITDQVLSNKPKMAYSRDLADMDCHGWLLWMTVIDDFDGW